MPILSLGSLYVFAVLPVAVVWGIALAIPAAVASVLAFNWFFLPPTHTFTLSDSENWLALAVYVVVAVVTSELAVRVRRRATIAEQREREAALLASVATSLLRGEPLEDEIDRISAQVAEVLQVSHARIDLVRWRARRTSSPSAPLSVGGRTIGTLATTSDGELEAAVETRFLPALASLLAVAVDRDELQREALEAETLRRSDVVKTAVLRAVSHDLRSPLTAIQAAASGLANPSLTLGETDRSELVETIGIESARLDRLVGDLLDLSRLQAGAVEPRRELWAVEDLVGLACEEAAAGDRVVLELPESLPPVDVDAAQVRRVLANLLDNALRVSPEGSIVRVTGEAHDREVILRIADQGPVSTPPSSSACSSPSSEVLQASTVAPGSGSPSRVASLKPTGAVSGRSNAGGRSSHRAGASHRRLRRARMSAGRILVVDDEPQILRALQTNLRGAGYEVFTAATAEAALTEAAARQPDAIILDLVLPDGNGTDVCRELRGWTSVPVIVLSAVGDEAEKVAALDAGADDYVTKPFGIDELLARLRASLRRAEPTDEPVIEIGDLTIDLEKRSVTAAGKRVQLTPHEFDAARAARAEPRQAPHARGHPARGLGPTVRPRVALPARLRLAAPPQDRARPGTPALSPHRARRRLPPRRVPIDSDLPDKLERFLRSPGRSAEAALSRRALA